MQELTSREQAQLFMLLGIAMAKGYVLDVGTLEGLGSAVRTKNLTQPQKQELLKIIAFLKDQAVHVINENFSPADMRMLESILKSED